MKYCSAEENAVLPSSQSPQRQKMTLKAARRNALKELRRRLFAALAYRGMTAEQFARSQDVLPNHLSAVLHDKRQSAKLLAAIVAFIVEFEREVCQELESGTTEAHLAQLVA